MNTKKILIAGVLGGIFSFFFGWLVFGILLKDMAPNNIEGLLRADEDFVVWAMAISSLLFGLLFAYIFVEWANISTWKTGGKAAAILGFLMSGSYATSMFAMTNIYTMQSMLMDIVANTIYSAVVGAFIGWWLGRK